MLRLVTAFLAISTGSLLGQSEATDWKRVEVWSESTTILGIVELKDSSWNQLQFRWKCRCLEPPNLLLFATGSNKEDLGSKKISVTTATGSVAFPVLEGTSTVTILIKVEDNTFEVRICMKQTE